MRSHSAFGDTSTSQQKTGNQLAAQGKREKAHPSFEIESRLATKARARTNFPTGHPTVSDFQPEGLSILPGFNQGFFNQPECLSFSL